MSNGVWISSATPLCRVSHHLQFWQKHQNGLLVPDDITAKFHRVYSSRPTAIASEKTRKGKRQTGFIPTPWTRNGGEWPRRCQDVCEAERDGERQQARREESTWGYCRKRRPRPRWIIHEASVHMRQPGNQRSDLVTIHFMVPHTVNIHSSKDPNITANHLPNTNHHRLADHKRTELRKCTCMFRQAAHKAWTIIYTSTQSWRILIFSPAQSQNLLICFCPSTLAGDCQCRQESRYPEKCFEKPIFLIAFMLCFPTSCQNIQEEKICTHSPFFLFFFWNRQLADSKAENISQASCRLSPLLSDC